ncbi:MAG: FlgD immunoglobulin-like domain containing protein, partial [bacterium]
NPETKIRFSVGKAGGVELAIFDLQGRLVRTLVNREMPVGNHAISWDGTETNGQKVASGRYIYRLSANGEVKSKMMVLVK